MTKTRTHLNPLSLLLVAATALCARAQDMTTIPVNAALYRTKGPVDGPTKFVPFKTKKGAFTAIVRLYSSPVPTSGQEPIWTYTYSIFVDPKGGGAGFSPAEGVYSSPAVLGSVSLILGLDPANPLPETLGTSGYFTTQVTTSKKHYGESPLQPLAIVGGPANITTAHTESDKGVYLQPFSISTLASLDMTVSGPGTIVVSASGSFEWLAVSWDPVEGGVFGLTDVLNGDPKNMAGNFGQYDNGVGGNIVLSLPLTTQWSKHVSSGGPYTLYSVATWGGDFVAGGPSDGEAAYVYVSRMSMLGIFIPD